jgi:DNA-binding NarL/FixJ family response regulator
MKPRLMLIADDPLSASGLRRALRAIGTFEVMDGYVEGGIPSVAMVAACRPDVVVVDELRTRERILARIAEVRAEAEAAKIVTLSSLMDPALLADISAAGADAAIAKTFRLDGIGALVREVAAGNVFHAFEPRHGARKPTMGSGLAELTTRELEILRRVAGGAPNSRIAAQLWITEQTVKFHLSNVYRKLGVSNRTEASHVAYLHGLLDTDVPARAAIKRAA